MRHLALLLLTVFVPFGLRAADSDIHRPRTLLSPAPPYVPRAIDYVAELGAIGMGEDLVWVGGRVGVHLGHCAFSRSETCQQYFDAIVGGGLREAETHGWFLGSLRWQYVNWPERHSPFWRVFTGLSRTARAGETLTRGAGGVGIGVINYLHRNVDLQLELRSGFEGEPFAQGVIAAQLKTDNLLEAFARKLKALGVGAVGTVIEATGTAIQATGEGLGGIVDGVATPFRNEAPPEAPTGTTEKSQDEEGGAVEALPK